MTGWGSRHDALFQGAVAIVRDGHAGHVGAGTALLEHVANFRTALGSAPGPRPETPGEVLSAVRSAISYVHGDGTDPSPDGPCTSCVPLLAPADPLPLPGPPPALMSVQSVALAVGDQIDPFERAVTDTMFRQRVRAEADKRLREDVEPAAGMDNPLRASLVTRDELRDLRRPDSLIAGTLDMGTTVLLYGAWGALKSFLALAWVLAVAAGIPWNGRRCHPGSALYVAAEGSWGMGGRLRAWETEHGPVPAGRFHLLRRAVNLADEHEVACLVNLIEELGVLFVVIDTLAKSSRGVDENSASEMGVVVAALERLRDATPNGEGVVVVVHHARKSSDDSGRPVARGSVAVESGVDTVYRITKSTAGVVVDRTKRKDGPEDDMFGISFRAVDDSDSGVLDYTSSDTGLLLAGPLPTPQRLLATGNRAAVLKAITEGQQETETVVDMTFIQRRAMMPRSTVIGCLSDLTAWGQVERVPAGRSYVFRTTGQVA